MSTFGLVTLERIGRSPQVSADGNPRAKVGGVTIDWSTVTAATVDTTYESNDFVLSGDKFIRYGTVVCKITASGLYGPYNAGASDGRQTLTKGNCYVINESVHQTDPHSDHPSVIDGGRVWKQRLFVVGAGAGAGTYGGNEVQTVTIDATGGTFTTTFSAQTTSAVAFNATAATYQTALAALSSIGAGNVSVTKAGSVFTVTFQGTLENTDVALMTTNAGSLTGGGSTATVALVTQGVSSPSLANFETAFPTITYVPE